MRKKILLMGVLSLFFIFFINVASAQIIPSTAPCWVQGTITGDGISVNGLTVGAYLSNTLLKSGNIASDGSYSLNSVGANDGNNISMKVYGHTFESFTFEGYCKTEDDPWIELDFTVSKVANGGACNNNAICVSGTCSSGVCAASSGGGSPGGGSPGGGSVGGSIPPVTPVSDEGFDLIPDTVFRQGFSKWLNEEEGFRFNVGGKEHRLTVNKITENSVTITVSSLPQTRTLNIGENWEVDVNDDGAPDVLIIIRDIIDNRVFIEVQSIVDSQGTEPVVTPPSKTTGGEQVKYPEGKTKRPWVLIWIIIILIIMLLVFMYVYREKRHHKVH